MQLSAPKEMRLHPVVPVQLAFLDRAGLPYCFLIRTQGPRRASSEARGTYGRTRISHAVTTNFDGKVERPLDSQHGLLKLNLMPAAH
jgi:hypothetical protein